MHIARFVELRDLASDRIYLFRLNPHVIRIHIVMNPRFTKRPHHIGQTWSSHVKRSYVSHPCLPYSLFEPLCAT